MLDSSNQARRCIAIFNAHWWVQSSIYYMASYLEKEGYHVDIFLYESNESLCDGLLKDSDSIKIYRPGQATQVDRELIREKRTGVLQKYRQFAKKIIPIWFRIKILEMLKFFLFIICPQSGIIPLSIRQKVIAMVRLNPYVAFIGVEKGGLYWAGEVAKKINIPTVYYNLELYTRNDRELKKRDVLRRLKPFEEKFHRRCALTIVQDIERGKILLSDNRVRRPMKMAYLPVSIAGDITLNKSEWLQNELKLPPGTVVILYLGFIANDRLCDKLVAIAQSFPEKWRLVLHGLGHPQVIDQMHQIDKLGRMKTSLRLVPVKERETVVRSAQIGLALYANDSLNARLTGFASEKIALYFKCGVPLIAFRYPSYEHIDQEKAGVLIDNIEEMPAAIEKILSDYDSYVQGAYECYKKYYCFETNFSRVLASLKTIERT